MRILEKLKDKWMKWFSKHFLKVEISNLNKKGIKAKALSKGSISTIKNSIKNLRTKAKFENYKIIVTRKEDLFYIYLKERKP